MVLFPNDARELKSYVTAHSTDPHRRNVAHSAYSEIISGWHELAYRLDRYGADGVLLQDYEFDRIASLIYFASQRLIRAYDSVLFGGVQRRAHDR